MGSKQQSVYAIIPAAGQGVRFGGPVGKQFRTLCGKPVILHTLEAFEACSLISGIVLVAPEGDIPDLERLLQGSCLTKVEKIVKGGKMRQDSVQKGLEALTPCELVVVHDGVRPLVTPDLITRTIVAARDHGAAVCGLPIRETVKKIGPQQQVVTTVDRDNLWSVQTPQAFQYVLLRRALQRAKEENFYGTDEAMLVERMGEPVKMVEGEAYNIKITTPEDLAMAEMFLQRGLDGGQGGRAGSPPG